MTWRNLREFQVNVTSAFGKGNQPDSGLFCQSDGVEIWFKRCRGWFSVLAEHLAIESYAPTFSHKISILSHASGISSIHKILSSGRFEPGTGVPLSRRSVSFFSMKRLSMRLNQPSVASLSSLKESSCQLVFIAPGKLELRLFIPSRAFCQLASPTMRASHPFVDHKGILIVQKREVCRHAYFEGPA